MATVAPTNASAVAVPSVAAVSDPLRAIDPVGPMIATDSAMTSQKPTVRFSLPVSRTGGPWSLVLIAMPATSSPITDPSDPLDLLGCKNHRRLTQPLHVPDHAEAADQRCSRVGHLTITGFSLQLDDRLGESDPSPTRTTLAAGELATAGVDGQSSGQRDVGVLDDPPALTAAAETEPLQLNQFHDRVVVVELDYVDVAVAQTRLVEHLGRELSPAGVEEEELVRPIVGSLATGEDADDRPVQRSSAFRRRHHNRLTAAARQNAVVQPDRITDQTCVEVIDHRHRVAKQSVGIEPGVATLRDRKLAELLARGAVLEAVTALQHCEEPVGAAHTVGDEVVPHAAVELIHHRVVRRDRIRVRSHQDDRLRLTRLDGTCSP